MKNRVLVSGNWLGIGGSADAVSSPVAQIPLLLVCRVGIRCEEKLSRSLSCSWDSLSPKGTKRSIGGDHRLFGALGRPLFPHGTMEHLTDEQQMLASVGMMEVCILCVRARVCACVSVCLCLCLCLCLFMALRK